MMRPTAHALVLLLAAVMIIASVVLTLGASRDCDRRGGTLVRNAWNFPVCVAVPDKR